MWGQRTTVRVCDASSLWISAQTGEVRSRRAARECACHDSVLPSRRHLLLESISATVMTQLGGWVTPQDADASLVLFPTAELRNRYYLIRAGQSENEAEDAIDTNPVNKTSMSNGLSELGKQQILKEVVPKLREMGACRGACWLRPSTTQNAYQTAELIAYAFGLGYDRIVPEYSFLDMRGVGAFDGLPPAEAYAKIHEIDSQGASIRPPPTYTGTPNESAVDVLIRVRQLLSVLETQYLNADVLVISPDSENLSVLQTAIVGEDNNTHWNRAFQPGECRHLELAQGPIERQKSIFKKCPRPDQCTKYVT